MQEYRSVTCLQVVHLHVVCGLACKVLSRHSRQQGRQLRGERAQGLRQALEGLCQHGSAGAGRVRQRDRARLVGACQRECTIPVSPLPPVALLPQARFCGLRSAAQLAALLGQTVVWSIVCGALHGTERAVLASAVIQSGRKLAWPSSRNPLSLLSQQGCNRKGGRSRQGQTVERHGNSAEPEPRKKEGGAEKRAGPHCECAQTRRRPRPAQPPARQRASAAGGPRHSRLSCSRAPRPQPTPRKASMAPHYKHPCYFPVLQA